MPSKVERVASLDLVRGTAAFTVAISHYFVLNSTDWPAAQAVSELAVEVFFVLSGFVLAPQILFCSRDGRIVNLWVFLTRRWMRTIPPFLVALVAISLLTDQLMTGDFFRYVFYVQNVFAQHNVQDYFAVAWSLSIEEWFYVTFPALMFVCARVFRHSELRFFIFVAVVFICIITALRMIFGVTQNWDELVRRIVVFRIDSIGYGFLLYVMMKRFGESWTEKPKTSTQFLTFGIFVACALLGFYVTGRAITAGYVVSQHIFPFIAAAFGMSTVLAFYMLDSICETRRISRFCVYFGRISYSVYLFHIMLILLMRPALQQLPIAVQIGIYTGGCVIFSTLFFYYFEKPILAARPKFKLAPRKTLRTSAQYSSIA